jgi:hypothetical protein
MGDTIRKVPATLQGSGQAVGGCYKCWGANRAIGLFGFRVEMLKAAALRGSG